jgi:hypothetical protein
MVVALAASAADRPAARDAAAPPPYPSVSSFELADQYGRARQCLFPGAGVRVITIADRKGSDQIAAWVEPLKKRYGDKVVIDGLADLSSVPSPLRRLVRERFKEKVQYPVMLDWTGTVVRQFFPAKGMANIYVVDSGGQVLLRLGGAAKEQGLQRLFHVLDRPPDRSSSAANP